MTMDDYPFSQFVGVDVSKATLDFALTDENSVSIKNTEEQIVSKLIGVITDPSSTIVVMEATGGYEYRLVTSLHQHNIAVAVVNPRRVRDFAKGIGIDAKTDPIDATVISVYGQVVKPAAQVAKSEEDKKTQSVGRASPPVAGVDHSGTQSPATDGRSGNSGLHPAIAGEPAKTGRNDR